MSAALINTDLLGLTLLSRGKVRDIYATSSPDHLLFVATDRISAYDVILRNVRFSYTVYLQFSLTSLHASKFIS